jgi:tyrosine-protein kinase Etk/Wzc
MSKPMAPTQSVSTQGDEIDLAALLGILIDHKWLIIAVTGLCFMLSVAYAMLATPIYQANALLQVEQNTPEVPGLTAPAQPVGTTISYATTEIALITSRTVIGKAVENLDLTKVVTPQRFPLVGNFIARRFAPDTPGAVAKPRFGLRDDDWGGSRLDVFQMELPDALIGQRLTLIAGEQGRYVLQDAKGHSLLQGQVGQVATGHGVTLQIQAMQANPGTHFHLQRNLKQATVSDLQGAIHASEQGKDSGIIQLTYENADPHLAIQFLDQVSQAYVRQNVERNSAEAANSLKFVKEQLPLVREKLEKATAALNAYQTQAHSVDITMQTKGLLDQVVAVETSIQQLRQQQAEMERLYTPDHPAYRAMIQQIDQLQAEKSVLEKQVGSLPDTQQQLLRLTREVQVSNDTYTNLLNQAQQFEIARAGTVGNVRIVDRAVAGMWPVSPKKTSIVFGGTVLGGLLAVVFVFLRQMLKHGVEDAAALEHLGLPVYASIPLSDRELDLTVRGSHRRRDGRQHLLALIAPADLATEALRSLRTSLHFARLEAKNNVLMISGPSPNVGKTFVSANLAVVITQAGQHVLLIDADMRKGGQHKVFGGESDNGLSELISGQIKPSAALRAVAGVDGLHFIARGKIPPNPSELLMHPNFTALLAQLMPRYDLIIIDTPPILAVTDAAVIGQHAGTSLLVVRFGVNQAREIALAKQRFEQNNVDIKGAIFNAVEKRASGYSSYSYHEYTSAK